MVGTAFSQRRLLAAAMGRAARPRSTPAVAPMASRSAVSALARPAADPAHPYLDLPGRVFARAATWVALAASLAAPAAGGLPPERERAVDEFVGQFVELAMFDGTVLIELGGEVVYEKSFGYANYEHGVRHDSGTRFRIASVSKTLTDAAFAVLIQRGELSLEAPLSRYLPDFPRAAEITIGHLLNHSSGIPHTNRQPWGDAKTSLSIDEIVERLAALPLDFEPGSDRRYSNGGYAVAAKVLGLVAGGGYGEAMRRIVFDPLGLDDTDHIADARAVIPRMATGYEPGDYPRERRHTRFYAVETRPGGGSLYSNPRDLLSFARAVLAGFVREDLRASVMGIGDGVVLSEGRSPGFVAKLLYDPERELVVVINSNSYAVPADWAEAIAALATGDPEWQPWPELRPAPPAVPADDPRLGRYRSSFGGNELSIERSPRGALVLADRVNDSITALVPLADGAFLQPLYFQRCERDASSRVITCRMLSGNPDYDSELTPLDD